jgi:hypothetical protein
LSESDDFANIDARQGRSRLVVVTGNGIGRMHASMTESPAEIAYVISMREVLWGITLIAVTMILHALGMVVTSRASQAMMQRRITSGSGFFGGAWVLVVASWMIVATHYSEVMVWAAFLVLRGALPTMSTANYYALLQYTTVGSGISLPYDWRLLGGMLPMSGMLTFAWSTAVLLRLAVQFEETQLTRLRSGAPSRRHEGHS